MNKKDTEDRATRLAYRNALISALFFELTNHEGYSFMDAYAFLSQFFGINDRQFRKILLQNVKVALSADDLTKLAVILQRISENKAY